MMKEKMRLIKLALKEWHQTYFANLLGKINSLKDCISLLEAKGELEVLSTEEVDDVHVLSSELHSLARINASIPWQQSRLLWLREGDANTKYFHAIMSGRKRKNAISSIMVNGVQVEGVNPVREAVFTQPLNHFQAQEIRRPTMDNLHFSMLSFAEGALLSMMFTMDEVKAAVWDCESLRAPVWMEFTWVLSRIYGQK